jgi:hypothetical protein
MSTRWFYKLPLRLRSLFQTNPVEQELTRRSVSTSRISLLTTWQKEWSRRKLAAQPCPSWAASSKSKRNAVSGPWLCDTKYFAQTLT